jgi:hypothetical protein
MSTSTLTPATTTPPEPPEPATEAPSAPQADQGAGELTPQVGESPASVETGDDERDDQGRYLSREAANYRRRLRETQAERDSLRIQLDQLQRAEVERLATAAGLAVASDVWMHGAALDTLRAEDGSIDRETVTGLVADIIKDRPGLRARPVGDIGIGRGAAAAGTTTGPKVGLSALFGKGA